MAANAGLGLCFGSIVKAHTISRAASLARIAKRGHVYSSPLSFSLDDFDDSTRIELTLNGINRASVFNGFCKGHDSHLFKEIDDPRPNFSDRYCLLLAYRNVAKELYLKTGLLMTEEDLLQIERGRPQFDQKEIRSMYQQYNRGTELAISELGGYKKSLEASLSSGGSGEWRHVVVRVEGSMPVLVSCAFQPGYLMSGERIQDLGDVSVSAESVSFSAVALDGGGAFIFSHRSDDKKVEKFVGSLLDVGEKVLPQALVSLAFEMSENLAVMPDWWEGLEADAKGLLTDSINRGLPFGEDSNESRVCESAGLEVPCRVLEILKI